MTTKIAITTPTGKNGRALTKRLLDVAKENQLEIVLLARDPEKVREFSDRGARVEKGSLDDAAFVARATAGVDALFWLTPQNFEPGEEVRAGYNRYGRVAAEAVKRNGIPHVVHLSGFDTEKDGEAGQIVDGLADIEGLLNDAATNITHVRAAFYFENYLGQLDPITSQGSVYMPVNGDTSVAMVATQDIAEVAARVSTRRCQRRSPSFRQSAVVTRWRRPDSSSRNCTASASPEGLPRMRRPSETSVSAVRIRGSPPPPQPSPTGGEGAGRSAFKAAYRASAFSRAIRST